MFYCAILIYLLHVLLKVHNFFLLLFGADHQACDTCTACSSVIKLLIHLFILRAVQWCVRVLVRGGGGAEGSFECRIVCLLIA